MLCKRYVPAITSVHHLIVQSLRVSLPILGARTKICTTIFAFMLYSNALDTIKELKYSQLNKQHKQNALNDARTSGTASGGLGVDVQNPNQNRSLPTSLPA